VAERGGFSMMSRSGGLKDSAVAGRPVHISMRFCTGIKRRTLFTLVQIRRVEGRVETKTVVFAISRKSFYEN
jgi:hypothetical protein